MNSSSVRNIAIFFSVLGAGIYFLRPSHSPSGVVEMAPVIAEQASLANKTALIPRAPSSTAAVAQAEKLAEAAKKPAATSPASSKGEKDKLMAQLQALHQCYASETCNFPQTDPRSYGFAVSREIAKNLQLFQKNFAKEFPEEARALALEFSSNEDGYVQEASLGLLQELPPTKESLKAVAQVVTETTDPSIVTQAMAELKRYVPGQDEAEVHQALGRVLSTGGMLTSQQASQGLLPFLNPKSVGYYQKVLKSLPTNSEVARNLRISLIEYQRMSTGG